MPRAKKSIDEVEAKQVDLEDAKREFLYSTGWKHTSETPGCFWMWVKETERYGRLMATTDHAISMQRHIDWFQG